MTGAVASGNGINDRSVVLYDLRGVSYGLSAPQLQEETHGAWSAASSASTTSYRIRSPLRHRLTIAKIHSCSPSSASAPPGAPAFGTLKATLRPGRRGSWSENWSFRVLVVSRPAGVDARPAPPAPAPAAEDPDAAAADELATAEGKADPGAGDIRGPLPAE